MFTPREKWHTQIWKDSPLFTMIESGRRLPLFKVVIIDGKNAPFLLSCISRSQNVNWLICITNIFTSFATKMSTTKHPLWMTHLKRSLTLFVSLWHSSGSSLMKLKLQTALFNIPKRDSAMFSPLGTFFFLPLSHNDSFLFSLESY